MKRLGLVAAIAAVTACSRGDEPPGNGGPAPASTAASQKVSLTAADLDGFEKGLAEEIRLVKEGKSRAAAAGSATERGNAIQSTFEENTIKGAIPKSGLSLERYHQVRDVMSRLLTTLDFQEKIPGPQSVDTTLADSVMKARLHSDAYHELDDASAALVKARLDRIAPLWIEYVTLTVAGG